MNMPLMYTKMARHDKLSLEQTGMAFSLLIVPLHGLGEIPPKCEGTGYEMVYRPSYYMSSEVKNFILRIHGRPNDNV